MALPTVIVQGNVCLEPTLAFTDAGKARLSLRVAAGERKKTESGEWVDGDTTFINCTLWGYAAESAAESVTKGTPVVVVGKLRSRTVEKDGTKTTYFDVDVDNLAVDVKRAAKAEPSDPWATTSPF